MLVTVYSANPAFFEAVMLFLDLYKPYELNPNYNTLDKQIKGVFDDTFSGTSIKSQVYLSNYGMKAFARLFKQFPACLVHLKCCYVTKLFRIIS